MAAYLGQSLGRASAGGGYQSLLPNGACAYRDLNAGAQALTCGCRRFWLNTGQAVVNSGESWCFCGHHACFHDNLAVPAPLDQAIRSSGENRHNVVPSTRQANAPPRGSDFMAPTWSELIGEHTNSEAGNDHAPASARSHAGLGIQNHGSPPRSQSQPHSINTRVWQALNGFARNQEDGGNSGATSNLPSTAVPSVCGQQRSGSPTQQLTGYVQATSRNMRPPLNVFPAGTAAKRTDEYSATEVATPSTRGTPELRAMAAVPAQIYSAQRNDQRNVTPACNSPQHVNASHVQPSRLDRLTPPPTGSAGPSLSIQEMCNTIQDFGRRISCLESVSFSHMSSDTVMDKFDLIDGRMIDLEHWRKELDKEHLEADTDESIRRANDRLADLEQWRSELERRRDSPQSEVHAESPTRQNRHRRSLDMSSLASDGSFDEDAAAQTETVILATLAASAETGPRIDALESRIVQLEASRPSLAQPWSIQVVLLPFSRQLPGIWFSASESSQQHSLRSQASEEWTATRSTLKSSFRSTSSSGWTTESIEAWNRGVDREAEWLSAKACGPSGTVFQRLASRGFVRDITFEASDSRSIWAAIYNGLGDALQSGAGSVPPVGGLQGLRERFVPLRKVRKSTRLRFLSPAEMVTPATWDADFLNSICMKINEGERRLYLTTAEGYLQPRQSTWSWRSLRDLPAYDADGDLQAAQVVGHVIEACWAYNDRLDHASSLHSSFQSEQSAWDASSDDGDQDVTGDRNTAMPSPSISRHSHERSLSFPSSSSMNVIDAETAPKRRAASFEMEPSIVAAAHSSDYFAKRRRVSNSPELERRGVNFTPRWSREPPSPYLGEDVATGRSSQAPSSRYRGTTPFAYATPHSNLESRAGDDGDFEINDINVGIEGSSPAEEQEEWHGVQDGYNDLQVSTQLKIQTIDDMLH